MLVIREEQKGAFSQAVARNFECGQYSHVSRVFPDRCRALGDPVVREWIRKGIREAAACGIDEEYEVSRYIDLMFLLSPDFGSDAQYAWAGPILEDASLAPKEKMDRLYERAREQLAAR